MTRHLERRILLLQILLGMVCCTSLSFLSLLLSRFGFNNLQIGLVMMAAACSTSIAKPCWGVFTDRVPCTRRILVITLALGIASFTLLGTLGSVSKGAAVVFLLLVEVTTGCMMGVVDSWIAKLIGTGCKINYGLTRAGISGAYAVSAACFGTVLDQYGVLPGAVALFVLLGLIALTVQGIPYPEERQEKRPAPSVWAHSSCSAAGPIWCCWRSTSCPPSPPAPSTAFSPCGFWSWAAASGMWAMPCS